MRKLSFYAIFLFSTINLISFSQDSFTGKVNADKVRIRLNPDLNSSVVKEAKKSQFFLIDGEENDFYRIIPPISSDIKLFVFRNYVLNGKVEASKVNIRLYPDIEAPVVGQLYLGDTVEGYVCQTNAKWLEIIPPENVRFYIYKNYISKIGNSDIFKMKQKKEKEVITLLKEANDLTDINKKNEKLNYIINNFEDFPEYVSIAKKQITTKQFNSKQPTTISSEWDLIEDELFKMWNYYHTQKNKNDFYESQKTCAKLISGKLLKMNDEIKNKPGNYILKNPSNNTICFLYSTTVDLSKYTNKLVSLKISSRDNKNFAYPTYFVHDINLTTKYQ